jgi:phosphate transport system protein
MTATLKHTDREYESELSKLREQLLLMGAEVEEMIGMSLRALVERDTAKARHVIELDHDVNRLEVEIDELCLRILAKRQPVASDLRFITIALKLVTDLERVGDLGVNISERVIELNLEPPLKPYAGLPLMAEAVQGMVREALDAFVAADAERARGVVDRDRIVDATYGQTFRALLTYMMEDPRNISRAMRLQSIAKYIERIGDHATNLAEMVVFMVKGKDIRHTGRKEPQARLPHGVLFLCTGNSARSQMAEGWARRLLPTGVRVWSAGTQAAQAIHPMAVEVMQEVGIDISAQRPKHLNDVPVGDVDTVVTLCPESACVSIAGELRREGWEIPDPAATTGSEAERLGVFRAARDEIQRRVEALTREWL